MVAKTFNLLVVGEDNTFKDVESRDYDLDAGLVRYKETVYDIRTGLWVVDMRHIRDKRPDENKNPWAGCPTTDKLTAAKMLKYVMDCSVFMNRLERARKATYDKAETRNKIAEEKYEQSTLF